MIDGLAQQRVATLLAYRFGGVAVDHAYSLVRPAQGSTPPVPSAVLPVRVELDFLDDMRMSGLAGLVRGWMTSLCTDGVQ
jgi:hypothetical protein